MKKILGAAVALSLIGSAAFADITVSGRGYVETQVFNYKTDAAGKNGETKLFDNWDTGDSDVFISGDIGGKAGAMLNIDFGSVANGISVDTTKKTISGSWIGDWNVWIKPLDFLTIKASNEANRVANRYNSIIDKTESKWGTLSIYNYNEDGNISGLNYKDANDDDSFKGYQVNMDFGVVKVDLGFNSGLYGNSFEAASMRFGDKAPYTLPAGIGEKDVDYSFVGTGARVIVPVEGLLNLDAFFKMKYDAYSYNKEGVDAYDKYLWAKFGVIADIVAIDNMGLAIGYIGDLKNRDVHATYNDMDVTEILGKSDSIFMNAVDVRFQYNMDKMGFALHNNATFGENVFANKTNLGFMYGLTDAATLFVEVQNYLAKLENVRFVTKAGEVDTLADVVTVYPRFAFGIAEGVTLKTGLRADFGLTEDFKQLEIALPLSMEVIF